MTQPNSGLQRLFSFLNSLLPVLLGIFLLFVIVQLCIDYGILRPAVESAAGTGPTIGADGVFEWDLLQVHDTPFVNGADASIKFVPEPPRAKVGFVQIVRTQDLYKPDRFYYPSDEKRGRSSNGWYVDRWDGALFPIFGMKNDCSEGTNVEIRNIATMIDRPYRPDRAPYLGVRWQAVVVPVPVPLAGQDFKEALKTKLGYYYWNWTVTKNGTLKDVNEGLARETLKDDIKNAFKKWWGTKGEVRCPPIERLTEK